MHGNNDRWYYVGFAVIIVSSLLLAVNRELFLQLAKAVAICLVAFGLALAAVFVSDISVVRPAIRLWRWIIGKSWTHIEF